MLNELKCLEIMELYYNDEIRLETVIENRVGRLELHIRGQERPQTIAMFAFDFIPTELSPEEYMKDILPSFEDDLYDYLKHGKPLRELKNEIMDWL